MLSATPIENGGVFGHALVHRVDTTYIPGCVTFHLMRLFHFILTTTITLTKTLSLTQTLTLTLTLPRQ